MSKYQNIQKIFLANTIQLVHVVHAFNKQGFHVDRKTLLFTKLSKYQRS